MQAQRTARLGQGQAQPAPGARPARRPGGRIGTIAIMVAIGAVLLALAYVTNSRPADGSNLQRVDLFGTPTGPAPIVGQVAPNLTLTTLEGSTVRIGDLKGKVVWLTFGATWCQPCRAENPDIEAAFEAFKAKGVVVLQMYMNEDAGTVRDYTERVGITYTRVPDTSGQLSIEYRILGIPTHFFVDRNGVLQRLKVGTLSGDEMTAILTELAG